MFFNGKCNVNGWAENRTGLKPKARPYNDNGGGKIEIGYPQKCCD